LLGHGLSQSRGLECLLIQFAEKFMVQRFDGAFDGPAADDEADVDSRRAMRNHRDVDLFNARKDSRGDARREFQVFADKTDQGRVALDRDLAQALPVRDYGVEME